ncbi:DUF397 domain-containing protein [Streptomyces sp. NPDC048172]|uniref:DUF397 domain-containing protein n=1 Tax=Streptomyces sp. NPDC048172 TaxID=3365505 RepID=UPI0037223DF5
MSNTPRTWVKSSYSSGDGGQCLEWAPADAITGSVPVRDSKMPDGPELTPCTEAFAVFVSAVQRGEL